MEKRAYLAKIILLLKLNGRNERTNKGCKNRKTVMTGVVLLALLRSILEYATLPVWKFAERNL